VSSLAHVEQTLGELETPADVKRCLRQAFDVGRWK